MSVCVYHCRGKFRHFHGVTVKYLEISRWLVFEEELYTTFAVMCSFLFAYYVDFQRIRAIAEDNLNSFNSVWQQRIQKSRDGRTVKSYFQQFSDDVYSYPKILEILRWSMTHAIPLRCDVKSLLFIVQKRLQFFPPSIKFYFQKISFSSFLKNLFSKEKKNYWKNKYA